MAQGTDAVTDLDKIRAEGLATEEEIRAWALTHGYGPGSVDSLVAEWAGDAPVVEEVVEKVKDELDLVEDKLIAEEEDDDDDWDDDDYDLWDKDEDDDEDDK